MDGVRYEYDASAASAVGLAVDFAGPTLKIATVVGGKKVTSIAQNAFAGKIDFSIVDLSETIDLEVGYNAFGG